MSNRARPAATALIAFAAALGGVALGHLIPWPAAHPPSQLRRILSSIDLDASQRRDIAVIEQDYDLQRGRLEQRMKAANMALGAAIQRERGNGPLVQQAVDRSHGAMGEIQKATIAEVFAIRRLLRPDQARRYDAGVVRTLTMRPG